MGILEKNEMYTMLNKQNSDYAKLYSNSNSYPNQKNAKNLWNEYINNDIAINNAHKHKLTHEESHAIVYWVYRTLATKKEREILTIELFQQIKELSVIKHNIKNLNGIFYNESTIDLYFFSSITQITSFISKLNKQNNLLFFRGHSNPNYLLCPSITRTASLQQNESKLYHDLLINCPDDFINCNSHLEKLVKMQHYGLPTRLLDITKNLLVALYFVCENTDTPNGEIILISTNEQEIKYPQSDTASLLASLPVFSYDKQTFFQTLAEDSKVSDEQFNKNAGVLLHEIRNEKPAFQAVINKHDILNNYIVYALKNNNRIIKQDGAFILCGLSDHAKSLEKFRYRKNNRKIIIIIKNKEKILRELETYSINRATLFPEIECVAEYLKEKYM